MHILVNLAEEANKALKSFEQAVAEGVNPFAFVSQDESETSRFVRTSVQAFHERGSQTEHFNEDKVYLIEFIGNRFNILFYNGAAVLYHKDHVDDFIK